MQNIKNYDEALKAMYEEHRFLDELVDNRCVFDAYRKSLDKGLDYIDFDGPFWDGTIGAASEELVKNGVTEFTISSTYSHVTDVVAEFLDLGWHIGGMTKVDSGYTEIDPLTGNEVPRMSNAFVLAR